MILVTGAAGYIGSHFVRQLLRERPDIEVLAVDNLSAGHREALPANEKRLIFAEVDFGEHKVMRSLLKMHPVDIVVHFAACAVVIESENNPSKYFTNNVSNTINLLSVMEEQGVRRIINSSSCSVYGVTQHQYISEQHPFNHIKNAYGLSKRMVEEILQTYERCHNWSQFSLRYFNAAGAEMDGSYGESHATETHLIPLILQTATGQQKEMTICGTDFETPDGTCIRDYVHVSDLCSAHMLALDKLLDGQKGAALNLGTGSGYSVKEVLDTAEKVVGKKIPHIIGPRRQGDPPCLVADTSKAHEQLNWHPKFNLDDIIRSAWAWEQNRRY